MIFLDTLKVKYNINLNSEQQKAVLHQNGPALILAGPGSGKTTVITARTAYLALELKVRPESILTLTFNKAAQLEMERRFNRIYGDDLGQKVHFSTMHSFCNRIVRDYESRQGRRLRRIEGEEIEDNKRKIIKNLYQDINNSKINDDELENLINEIGFVKNKMIKEFDGMSFSTKNFANIYKAYEEYKKSNLYIDFDDMLTYAYNILVKCPDILSRYKNKYKFIQVDEGQDLSKIQFETLKLLVNQENCNIFVVADDDQSIYGFRGADPQYILDINKQFKECSIYKLENNYRSTKNIVEASSEFIRKNTKRFDKSHKTDNDYRYEPNIIKVQDENDQINYVIKELEANSGRSAAILYRNNLSSIVLVDALERKGIPFRVRQNKLFFFNHWIVQDILAFLKFALNQCDGEAFTRIYYKMNRYISKAMLEYALNVNYKESIIDGILQCCDIKPYTQRAIQGLKIEFIRLSKKHPILALEYIEERFRYFDSVSEYCENTGICYEYLYSLFGILKTIACECETIPIFLKRIDELKALFENPGAVDYKKSVTLTTMHSSKGLEYDVVFMVDLIDDETPGTKAIDLAKKNKDESILEEERRLFYVAMTRAKEQLYMISPSEKNGINTVRSTFVNEFSCIVTKKAEGDITEGMILNHKYFGEGVISSIINQEGRSTIIEIDFGGMRKRLDFSICLENGLITF